MATPKKKPAPRRAKTKAVESDSYSRLEEYCIWLNEYYRALKRAGFNDDMAFWLISSEDSYPDWVKGVRTKDIVEHIEDEEDE